MRDLDYDKQDKQKVGEGDEVKFTKPKKNEDGEWNIKVYVNGKNYKPAEIFADSKEDAVLQAKDARKLYKEKGAIISGGTKEKEVEDETEDEGSLKEEILKLSGLLI